MDMEKWDTNKLEKAYLEAKTSVAQERAYLNQNGEPASPRAQWSDFVARHRVQVPKGLQEDLWESFERKSRAVIWWRKPIVKGAVAVVLVGLFYFGAQLVAGREYERKEALLQQAQQLFSETPAESVRDSIIYETEVLIIYTTQNWYINGIWTKNYESDEKNMDSIDDKWICLTRVFPRNER